MLRMNAGSGIGGGGDTMVPGLPPLKPSTVTVLEFSTTSCTVIRSV